MNKLSIPRIYIGYDSTQHIAYEVLQYSLRLHASRNLDINPICLRHLERDHGWARPIDPLQSTEFTYTRFLVPYLCDYKGIALFMDCDMLCLADISELFQLEMENYALRVVKHHHHPTKEIKMGGKVQASYPRKNWSSLMLMNCEYLQIWTLQDVQERSGAWLHRFEPIPDELIGDLPPEWNVLDRYGPSTKLIHYTDGGPWLPGCENHPYGDIWLAYAREFNGLQTKKRMSDQPSFEMGLTNGLP
jgi:Glycosyl transferase family 8